MGDVYRYPLCWFGRSSRGRIPEVSTSRHARRRILGARFFSLFILLFKEAIVPRHVIEGNVTAIPIMSVLGLGMGMLIWGATNCITGWAVGRYSNFR